MKKMMMVLAAVCAAGLANAACLNWGSGIGGFAEGGYSTVGSVAYLFFSDNAFGDMSSATLDHDKSGPKATLTVAGTSYASVDSHVINENEANTLSWFNDSYARDDYRVKPTDPTKHSGIDGYYMMVLVDKAASDQFSWVRSSEIKNVSDTSDPGWFIYDQDFSGNPAGNLNVDPSMPEAGWLGNPSGTVGGFQTGATPVPEPMCVALLAFGAVALGLRRKRS